jgi:hypothetical protein
VLASTGGPFSKAVIRKAGDLAGDDPITVVSILKIYGSSWGLPVPGLMPTPKERQEQLAIVSAAIEQLERRGCVVDGQIAATRTAGKTIARIALARGARIVVMDDPGTTGVRRFVEGDIISIVRRRLGGVAALELVGGKSRDAPGSRDPRSGSRRPPLD